MREAPLNDILHAHDKEERYTGWGCACRSAGSATPRTARGAMYLMCNGYVTAQVLGIDRGQEVMD